MAIFSYKREVPRGTGMASQLDIDEFRAAPLTWRLQAWYPVCSSWGMGQAMNELGLILRELGDEREKEGK